jgi:PAS domain S-box-containing protein
MNLSVASKISLGISIAIIFLFLSMQTAMVIGYAEINFQKIMLGWFSVILFMPFFFFVVVEVTRKMRYRLQTIDDTLSAINKSSITVELDTDGTIIDCNEIFCEALGYSREELIGMKHRELTGDDKLDSHQYNSFWYDLSKGRVKSGEFLRKKKNGDLVWIYGTYNPIMNPYGEVYRVLSRARR